MAAEHTVSPLRRTHGPPCVVRSPDWPSALGLARSTGEKRKGWLGRIHGPLPRCLSVIHPGACARLRVGNMAGLHHWIYRIRAVADSGRTEAVYVGMTADLDSRWRCHRKEIRDARGGSASEFKYGYLANYPDERLVFEVIAEVAGKYRALDREEFEIALARKDAGFRCLNVLVTNDIRSGYVYRSRSGKAWVIVCRRGRQPGDEVVAILEGSKRRGLVRLVARTSGGGQKRTENWTFVPLGIRWETKYVALPAKVRNARHTAKLEQRKARAEDRERRRIVTAQERPLRLQRKGTQLLRSHLKRRRVLRWQTEMLERGCLPNPAWALVTVKQVALLNAS